MSPFCDLGQHCGGPFPVESARSLRSSCPEPVAGWHRDASTEFQVVSLSRLVRLISLAIVGLAGLFSRGVGGVILVQSSAFRVSKVDSGRTGASRHEEMEYSRALYMPPNHRDGAIRRTGADDEDDN